jgi:hypothetical protein
MTGTDLARYQAPPPPTAQEFEHMERMSKVLAKSGLVPEYFRGKPDDIVIAGLGLRSNHLPLDVNTISQVYVVKGKPGYMAQIQIALALRAGIDIQYDQGECDDKSATVEIRDRNGWHKVTFTMADAIKARLPDQNPTYKTYPDRMLLCRAITKAIGVYAPHVKLGIDIDPQAMEHPAEDEIVPHPPAGGDAGAVEQVGPPPPAPAPAPFASEAAKRRLLAVIAGLDPSHRDALKEAMWDDPDLPPIKDDRFTVLHLARTLELVDETWADEPDKAEAVRGSAVEEVGDAPGPDHKTDPEPTYAPGEEPFD